MVGEVDIQMAQKAGIFKGMGLAHRFRDETEKAIALDPKSIDAREAMMEYYFDAPGLAGGDKKKAHEAADEIGKLNTARGLLAQATLAGKEKDTTRKAQFYEEALAAAPHDATVLTTVSAFYSSDGQKKYDLAIKYATEALKVDEGQIGPYSVLAAAYAGT